MSSDANDIEAPLVQDASYGAVDPDDAAKPQEKGGGGKYADKSSDRFWLDIAVAVGAAVAIVTTFFVTISYMNYTYKHTQFELHTECVSSEVKERMRARGFDFDVDEIDTRTGHQGRRPHQDGARRRPTRRVSRLHVRR